MTEKPRPRGKVKSKHARQNKQITAEGTQPPNWRYCHECKFYYPPNQQSEHNGHGTKGMGW